MSNSYSIRDTHTCMQYETDKRKEERQRTRVRVSRIDNHQIAGKVHGY